jgi:hypothetical protein
MGLGSFRISGVCSNGGSVVNGLAALIIEGDLLGEQAMAQGILGTKVFPLLRNRAVGAGAMGPRISDCSVGIHGS